MHHYSAPRRSEGEPQVVGRRPRRQSAIAHPKSVILLLFALLMLPAGARAEDLLLADRGAARYTLVQAADAAEPEKTAVRELAEHLKKITGAEFAIVPEERAPRERRIVVGPGRLSRALLGKETVDALGPEEFVIRTVKGNLVLAGGRPRGTLYAAYSFLEDDLGCRWLTWWGDEEIPHRERLAIPELNRREAPVVQVRDIVTHTNPYADRPTLQRFLVRNRDQGPDLGFTGDLAAYGGVSHRYGLPKNGWFVHTLFHWIPPEQYFQEHPEYYSLLGGKRTKAQLCFSDPGLRKTLTENILQRIGELEGVGNFSLSAQDAPGDFCQCPACADLIRREETPGAPLFAFMAELAPVVKAKYPKAFLTTLAYRKDQTEKPPRALRMPENVAIIFAPIDDNFAAPLEHPTNQGTAANLAEWRRHADHVWIWYYPNPYGGPLPIGNLNRLARDFRLFGRLGVEGLFLEHDAAGVYDGRGLPDLQTWVMLKLMWNPERDLDRLVRDFTEHTYGAAAPVVREYIAALEQATQAMPTRMGWNAAPGQFRFLTPDLLASLQALFDRAEKTVVADAPRLANVRRARMSTDYASIRFRPALAGRAGLSREGILARYQETYTRTVDARVVAERRPALKKSLEEFTGWRRAMTPLKPLPAPLDAVPAARVRQLTPDTAQLHGPAKLVADPEAAAGIAAVLETEGKVPFDLGFYDIVTKRQQHLYPGKDQPIQPDRYDLYKIGRTRLNEQCYVWFDWSWRIQFPDVAALYDPAHPEKEWEVYASVRLEGPAFGSKDAKPHRFAVDRVVLVEVAP